MRITEKKFTRTRAMAVKAEILTAAARGDTELDFADVESADSSAVAVVMAWVLLIHIFGLCTAIMTRLWKSSVML